MKKRIFRIFVIAASLFLSTGLLSAESGATCTATAYCFDDGIKYGEVSCTGKEWCLTFYEKVTCDGKSSFCIDPALPM